MRAFVLHQVSPVRPPVAATWVVAPGRAGGGRRVRGRRLGSGSGSAGYRLQDGCVSGCEGPHSAAVTYGSDSGRLGWDASLGRSAGLGGGGWLSSRG